MKHSNPALGGVPPDLAELAALAGLYNNMAAPQLQQQQQTASEQDHQFQSVLALLGLHQHMADTATQQALEQARLDQSGAFHTADQAQRASEFGQSQQTANRGLDLQAQGEQATHDDRAAALAQAGQFHGEDAALSEKQHHAALMSQFFGHALSTPGVLDPALAGSMLKELGPEFAGPIGAFQHQQDESLVNKMLPAYGMAKDDATRKAILAGVPSNLQDQFTHVPGNAPSSVDPSTIRGYIQQTQPFQNNPDAAWEALHPGQPPKQKHPFPLNLFL